MNNQYQLNNIKFSYADELILDIERHCFESGKITALVGNNGAGKSTLLGMLSFLLVPDSGDIRYAGETVRNDSLGAIRKQVGLVQQNPYLIKGSVAKNIELGLKFHGINPVERENRVRNMLRLLKIEKLADRSVKSLSGGEAQKVAIGRTLALGPEVVLLDEPFTYLDREFVEEFEELIKHLRDNHNKTIIFTTHNELQAQALSDQVFRIINASLIEASISNLFYGSVDELTNEFTEFDTGKIRISVPSGHAECKHLSIDPGQIVLSREPLESSMRNSFEGEVTGMMNENGQVRVTVDGAERFHVYITRNALNDMGLNIDNKVLISFKSSSVNLF